MGTHGPHTSEMVINVQPVSPTTTHTTDTKRKVSIVSEPIAESRHAYENLGFDHPHRKISTNSAYEGPLRKKSILLNSNHPIVNQPTIQDSESINSHHSSLHNHAIPPSDPIRHNGAGYHGHKKHSVTDSLHSRVNRSAQIDSNIEQSWIFALCMRCRVEYNTPSWEPPYWQKFCPYPLCPSFRQFARLLSIVIIGVLTWIVAYAIIGESAGPGGQLFQLVILTVAAHFGGWLISLTTLPRLIGMLLVGLLFANLEWVEFTGDFSHVTAELRKFALTIILIRAGLEMDPEAFKKIYVTILKLGLVPWMIECVVVAICSYFFLDLPWIWAFALGSIIAAVSPAVVVPCLFRLRTKGYGVAKGIPTLIIAVAGIDDAASVAIFGIISTIIFSADRLGYQISQAPVCVLGGLGFGVVWGYLSRFIPEKGDAFVVPIRLLMLLVGGAMAIFASEKLGYEGAGPLGVVFAAFISNYFWCQQGWEVEDNPVSTGFEIFWMIFEPILFGVTGASIIIKNLDPNIVTIGVGIIFGGVILRILGTIAIAFGDKLNIKEKIFVSLSWMAKATVQAALGPVTLRHLSADASSEERRYAETILMISILSIILTAPIGAILISITGTKLLTKTRVPVMIEGWRRSHRPSLYDISIIDEQEEREDPEMAKDSKTIENTNTNAHITAPPIYTVNN